MLILNIFIPTLNNIDNKLINITFLFLKIRAKISIAIDDAIKIYQLITHNDCYLSYRKVYKLKNTN